MASGEIDGVDYGPLALLVGRWKGDKGMDVAPVLDGSEKGSPFFEEIVFEAAGDVTNAGRQTLAIVRYHQKVFDKGNGKQFHDQLGYWLWDEAEQTVMHTISIPRGVTLVAGGKFDSSMLTADSVTLRVASEDGGDWGVAQSPFMRDNARTKGFAMEMLVKCDQMSYSETTFLDIYGRGYDHTDNSKLRRV